LLIDNNNKHVFSTVLLTRLLCVLSIDTLQHAKYWPLAAAVELSGIGVERLDSNEKGLFDVV
jgi:hypothetical protein